MNEQDHSDAPSLRESPTPRLFDLPDAPFLPAITLWQPFASLIFVAKPWETRKGKLPAKHVGQPVIIHAATAYAPAWAISDALHELCMDVWGCGYDTALPRAAALGTAIFGPCRPTEEVAPGLTADELAAGDFSPGRRAWPVRSSVEFRRPIPARGSQGWWRFDRTLISPSNRKDGSAHKSPDTPSVAGGEEP